MTSKLKHMQRSHRSYRKGVPDRMFLHHAQQRLEGKMLKERGSIFQILFHRMTNLTGNINHREKEEG